MIFQPTTTVNVFRGPGEPDEWGGETDNTTTALHRNVPAAVTENTELRFAPADLRSELVEQFTVRVPAHYGITHDDRLIDQRDGSTYQVQGVSRPQSLVGTTSTRLTAKRVGAGQ